MIKLSELSGELRAKLKAADNREEQRKILVENGYKLPLPENIEDLGEELLAKLKAAGSRDEQRKILIENGYEIGDNKGPKELSEEELEEVSGGKWTDFLKTVFTVGLSDSTCSGYKCRYCGYEGVGNEIVNGYHCHTNCRNSIYNDGETYVYNGETYQRNSCSSCYHTLTSLGLYCNR